MDYHYHHILPQLYVGYTPVIRGFINHWTTYKLGQTPESKVNLPFWDISANVATLRSNATWNWGQNLNVTSPTASPSGHPWGKNIWKTHWVFEDLSSWFTALAKTQYMGVLLISLSDFFVKFLQSHQGEIGSENVAKNPIPWFRTSNVPYWWLCYWRFHPPCLDKPINRTLIYVYILYYIHLYTIYPTISNHYVLVISMFDG